MIVLPNSFERYLNNLRIITSLSVLKHGLKPRHLVNLRKLYLAEAFLYKDCKESVNLKLLSFNILCCVKTIKEFNFKININKNVLTNKRLLTALLLLSSHNSQFLNVEFKDGIIIKGNGNIKNSRKVIKYLNGCSFFDIKTKNYLIFIPCKTTEKASIETESQWQLLFDRFSVFNLFYG